MIDEQKIDRRKMIGTALINAASMVLFPGMVFAASKKAKSGKTCRKCLVPVYEKVCKDQKGRQVCTKEKVGCSVFEQVSC